MKENEICGSCSVTEGGEMYKNIWLGICQETTKPQFWNYY